MPRSRATNGYDSLDCCIAHILPSGEREGKTYQSVIEVSAFSFLTDVTHTRRYKAN